MLSWHDMNQGDHPLTDADFAHLLAVRDGLRSFLHWSEAKARDAGLTAMQHQLLLVIRGHGTTPAITDIASHLMLRHHSVVELVDRAERAGLVERRLDEHDHRIARVSLTARGEQSLRLLSAAHLEELARLEPVFAPLREAPPKNSSRRRTAADPLR